jgi:hypothetical protein
VIEPAELFARLTCEMEDLHALAVEGQAADQPDEALSVLAIEICNGLQRSQQLVGQINHALVDRS